MGGHFEALTWRDQRARAWVPDPVRTEEFTVSTSVARRTEQAAASVRRADENLPGSALRQNIERSL